MVLIHKSRSEEIGDALIEYIITKYCMPDYTMSWAWIWVYHQSSINNQILWENPCVLCQKTTLESSNFNNITNNVSCM